MKKYFKIENLLYLMLIISPFLDSFSFIFRSIYKDASISPVTIIRPIIPVILAIYLFIKDKTSRKTLIIGGIIYFIYGIIHLIIYNDMLTGISYGGILHEAQYVLNYTYMILVLYLFVKFDSKLNKDKINKTLLIMLAGYLILIYISILTNTSSSTYIEGIGYKGWNLSGNSVGSVLILLECILLPFILKKNNKSKYFNFIIFLLLGIFLTFLLGTRVGLYGFYLVLLAYILVNIFINIINKKYNITKYVLVFIVILLIPTVFVKLIGSNTYERREHLENVEDTLYDDTKNETSHVTGDTLKFLKDIKENKIDEEFMSYAQQNAYLDLYDFANKYEIQNNNQRALQIIYHLSLIKHQKNPVLILFGNGYEINYGEMTLEMEFIAILFNFGIIGFILYLIPFLIIDIKSIKYALKNIKNISIEYIMLLVAAFLAIVFSLLAGYTFFNPSSMYIIVVIHLLLRREYLDKN